MGAILAAVIIAAILLAIGVVIAVFVYPGGILPAETGDSDTSAGPALDVKPTSPNSTDISETGATVDPIDSSGTALPLNTSSGRHEMQSKLVEIKHVDHLVDILSRSGPSMQFGHVSPRAVSEPVFFDAPNAGMLESESSMDFATDSEFGKIAVQPGEDYSTTNVQVAGVDEPDYIKNDGEYAYIAIRNMLTVVDVWPASEMHTVAKVALDIDPGYIDDIFLNGDTLVMLYASDQEDMIIPMYDFMPQRSYKSLTNVLVMNITDRTSPEIRADYQIDGWFKDARMIGDHVYVITSSSVDYDRPELPIITGPSFAATPTAYYFDDEWQFSTFTTIAAIDISPDAGSMHDRVASETFLMGHTGTFYVTSSNLYLTYVQNLPPEYSYEQAARERFFGVIFPLLPDHMQNAISDVMRGLSPGGDSVADEWPGTVEGHSRIEWRIIESMLQGYYNELDPAERDDLIARIQDALASYDYSMMKEQTRTVIHKVAVNGSSIDYLAHGSVPGRLLNQFSLGESGGGERLRVATTVEYYTAFAGFSRSNSVYALDADMNMVGYLEGVAEDERIYSARFMDDRLYLVTFQQIDPFFVIDISQDTPRILGELKIPGFSNYLHPYDDNLVIGLGRDTTLVDGQWVQQLGIKVALFDVANVSNPIVADEIIIGDSSTYSDALHTHMAFFLDKRHGTLSIPIEGPYKSLEDALASSSTGRSPFAGIFSDEYWHGFYVMNVSAAGGLDVRGTVGHPDPSDRYDGVNSARTFYIGDVLYTISGTSMVASNIDTLDVIRTERLVGTGVLVDYLE